ncbi:MAG: hypothetical protein JNM20_15275 [Rhizobiales bacterium]|nr:hypothetical protein [Hyphomicrobiales bacterium]
MATAVELQARLEALRKVRANGLRSIQYEDIRTEYRSDAELAAAITDLEQQLAAASGRRIRTVTFSTSKGV